MPNRDAVWAAAYGAEFAILWHEQIRSGGELNSECIADIESHSKACADAAVAELGDATTNRVHESSHCTSSNDCDISDSELLDAILEAKATLGVTSLNSSEYNKRWCAFWGAIDTAVTERAKR